jgi:hypothetical protein
MSWVKSPEHRALAFKLGSKFRLVRFRYSLEVLLQQNDTRSLDKSLQRREENCSNIDDI